MTRYSDLSYDQQRALLGLPNVKAAAQVALAKRSLRQIRDWWRDRPGNGGHQSDYALAGRK